MKHAHFLAAAFLFLLPAAVWAQDTAGLIALTPGIKVDPDGLLTAGDVTAEVCHFNTDWSVTEQHDAFVPAAQHAPTTQPSTHIINGVFTTASGPFNLTERFDASDSGVKWNLAATCDKEVGTNELYVSLTLPTDSFAGKQIMVDQQTIALPAAPAKAGESGLFDSDSAQKIQIKTTGGTLVITGDLSLHLQDDREWSNDRYSLRINFTPSSGQIKDSHLVMQMKWIPG